MAAAQRYEIGSAVRCSDGECGELAYVVVDPVADRLAHLIVVPGHGGASRLVPVERAGFRAGAIVLDCTRAEFDRFEPAVRTHFVDAADAEARYGYRDDQVVSWPYFGLGPARPMAGFGAPGPFLTPAIELEDRVPLGEVRVRRGEPVHARDGRIGRVRGLVVDPADEAVTHVLLDEGHLWGRKLVAIPIGMVGDITEEEVAVRLSKHEIKDLPPVAVAGLE
ncbi:hypothetical protein GCM10009839_08770 [Catenulispora yoronensis]|uniref:PRC-barrel domain-containing protein n=1 Tax=Catenulispora yoronensis TaxID=450799 RepID=A0ABP5F362_9ACTN